MNNLKMAGSSLYSVKPEFADMVKRVTPHIPALETLQIYNGLVMIVAPFVWGFLFPIRKGFTNRQKDGPRHLLAALGVLLGVHTLGALMTLPIPLRDTMGVVDIMQIRVLPFVMGFIMLSLTPFFGKKADIYYQYVAVDRDCFKKNGVALKMMKTKQKG